MCSRNAATIVAERRAKVARNHSRYSCCQPILIIAVDRLDVTGLSPPPLRINPLSANAARRSSGTVDPAEPHAGREDLGERPDREHRPVDRRTPTSPVASRRPRTSAGGTPRRRRSAHRLRPRRPRVARGVASTSSYPSGSGRPGSCRRTQSACPPAHGVDRLDQLRRRPVRRCRSAHRGSRDRDRRNIWKARK